MIKDVAGIGPYVEVHSGSTGTYVNNGFGSQGVGNLRYNTSIQQLEVYDGQAWITLNSGITTIGLTREAVELLNWAKKEKRRQEELERLAKNNVTIQDALGQLRHAEERVRIIQTLCEKSEKEENA